MNNRLILILAAVVLAICVGAAWFLQSQPKQETARPIAPASPAPTPDTSISVSPPRPSPTKSTSTIATVPKKAQEPARPLAEWEVKIDQALRADIGETETAQLLINMLPTLPADGQAEAAQHISNLLLDKDYNRVLPLVRNPNLPEEVLDVFMTDLMNRDDSVKLPVMLDIAKIPNHPHREEAHTDLEIFLDEDYGTDWAKWDLAMKTYLAKEAAEEAADAAASTPGANPLRKTFGVPRPGVPPRR